MKLSKEDKELIEKAKVLINPKKVDGGEIKEVGSALCTKEGKIFTGANMDLYTGVGFCAERSAMSNMISHSDETEIKTIVAFGFGKIMPPCGSCREMMQLINKKNRKNTYVIISKDKKVKLKELLPHSWI